MNATATTLSVAGEPCELLGFPGSSPIALVRFESGRLDLVHVDRVAGAEHPGCEVCESRPKAGRGRTDGAWFSTCEPCSSLLEEWEPTTVVRGTRFAARKVA